MNPANLPNAAADMALRKLVNIVEIKRGNVVTHVICCWQSIVYV